MKEVNVLGKVCRACGTERKTKALLYDPQTFHAYCQNPYICNEKHPNSPHNLIERGSILNLVPYHEVEKVYKDHLLVKYADPEVVDRVRRMVTKPTTVRILDPDLAKFLIDLEKENNFASTSDTIRYCVQVVMESQGVLYKDHKDLKEEKQKEENLQDAITGLEKPKIFINQQPKEQDKDEEDDDEVVFDV